MTRFSGGGGSVRGDCWDNIIPAATRSAHTGIVTSLSDFMSGLFSIAPAHLTGTLFGSLRFPHRATLRWMFRTALQ